MRFSRLILYLSIFILLSCNDHLGNVSVNAPINLGNTLTVLSDSLSLNKQNGRVYYQGTVFNGTSVSYYSNGILASSIDYLEGKKHGFYRKWFSNSDLSYEASYEGGKLQGSSRTWWVNGNFRSVSNFFEGVPHGEQVQYYKSGVLFKRLQLDMGKESGLQQSWRENGKLFNNYEARDGRIYGLKRSKLCFELEDEEVKF